MTSRGMGRAPERIAGGFDRLDGTIQFYQRVNALLRPEFTVVDFGAGRGVNHIEDTSDYRRGLISLKGKVKEVVGIDVDEAILSNPAIDRAVVITNSEIPLPDESVDLILSDFTFEHLPDPAGVARSFGRILKPGGWICARTPNRRGYIALGNRIIPDLVKMRVLQGAQPTRKSEDVFPAVYRMNTIGDLKGLFPTARFEHCSYLWDSSPSYFFNRGWVFQLFRLLHAVTPERLKTMLMIFIQKRA
jgi:SAM-dependent methyltransferase